MIKKIKALSVIFCLFPFLVQSQQKSSVLIKALPDKEIAYWETSILHYRMKGHHLLAGEALTRSLYKELGNWVPHFLIINKEGSIIERNAPSPEQPDVLYDKLVEWNNK